MNFHGKILGSSEEYRSSLEERGQLELILDVYKEVFIYWNKKSECVVLLTEDSYIELIDSKEMSVRDLLFQIKDVQHVSGDIRKSYLGHPIDMDNGERNKREREIIMNIPIRNVWWIVLQVYGR